MRTANNEYNHHGPEQPIDELPDFDHPEGPEGPDGPIIIIDEPPSAPRKFYVDGGGVEIAATVIFDLDTEGRRLRMIKLADYAGEKVRTLWRTPDELRDLWVDVDRRDELIAELGKRGIELSALGEAAKMPDADPLDLLCHLAFQSPVRTRKERAAKLKDDPSAFLGKYSKEAREILTAMLGKYEDHGTDQFSIPAILEVPPISSYGNIPEIIGFFGGSEQLIAAVSEMQRVLYAA